MFCQRCGKEILNQARFCSSCGAPVPQAQPAPARQPVQQPVQQPVRQPAQQPVQQPPKAENSQKGGLGKRILSALVAVAVFYFVKTAVYHVLTKPDETPAQSSGTGVVDIQTTGLISAMSDCINGALYENGYLRYGFARLSLPDYQLHTDDQSSMGDYLLSQDGYSLFNAMLQREPMGVSYEATVENDLLESIRSAYPDARMIDFRKEQQDGAYVIRAIYRYTDNGTDLYTGELILMPEESCRETIRLYLFQNAEIGYDRINQVFDSLSISAEYAPSSSETTEFGYNQITVK